MTPIDTPTFTAEPPAQAAPGGRRMPDEQGKNRLAPLLMALGRAGVELAPHPTDPARLRHRPADLTPELSARLRTHRAAVLGVLVNGYAPDPHGDTDAGYIVAERLGIADDLGMPTHPGSPAWLAAVGEALDTVPSLVYSLGEPR